MVFDWNGTLLDDTKVLVDAVNMQLDYMGVPRISVEDYREHYSIPIRECLHRFGVTDEIYQASSKVGTEIFHREYETLADTASLADGTVDLLHNLKSRTIENIILSNHIVKEIRRLMVRHDLERFISNILANDAIGVSDHTGKQHRIEHFLEINNIDPDDAVIIGDTVEEINIGKHLGMKTISLSTGANSTSRLKNEHPDLLVDSLREIIPKMEELGWLQ